MKKIIVIGLALVLLAGCGSTEESKSEAKDKSTQSEEVKNTKEKGPLQEELNDRLKQEAEEVNFEAASYGEYEIGKKLKITGKITGLKNVEKSTVPEFTLTTEGDGYGMYKVMVTQPEVHVNQDEIILKNGVKLKYAMPITVYGTYNGKDEYGVPHISSTIVETNIKH